MYLETVDVLASAISQGKTIKTFHAGKLGANPLFALDSTKRLLVIFATPEASGSYIKGSSRANHYSVDLRSIERLLL